MHKFHHTRKWTHKENKHVGKKGTWATWKSANLPSEISGDFPHPWHVAPPQPYWTKEHNPNLFADDHQVSSTSCSLHQEMEINTCCFSLVSGLHSISEFSNPQVPCRMSSAALYRLSGAHLGVQSGCPSSFPWFSLQLSSHNQLTLGSASTTHRPAAQHPALCNRATLFWRACGAPHDHLLRISLQNLPITAPWATLKRSRFWGQNFESPKHFKLQNIYQVYHPKPELVWTEPSCIHYFTSNTGRQIHALQGLPMVSQEFTAETNSPWRPLRTAAWHETCRSLPRSMHFASPQFIENLNKKWSAETYWGREVRVSELNGIHSNFDMNFWVLEILQIISNTVSEITAGFRNPGFRNLVISNPGMGTYWEWTSQELVTFAVPPSIWQIAPWWRSLDPNPSRVSLIFKGICIHWWQFLCIKRETSRRLVFHSLFVSSLDFHKS